MSCDHTGLDAGPCKHVKPDRCPDCCLTCNRLYRGVHKTRSNVVVEVRATDAVAARRAAYDAMHAAGYAVKYTDFRVSRMKGKTDVPIR